MRKLVKTLGIASLAATASLSTQAAEETFQASAEILNPITIANPGALSFGKIIAPDNGSPNNFSDVGGASGAGNGSSIVGGNGALITFTSDAGQTFGYTVAAGACSDPANLTLNLAFSDSGISGGGQYSQDLTTQASLDVESGTPAGSYTCDWTVTANYE